MRVFARMEHIGSHLKGIICGLEGLAEAPSVSEHAELGVSAGEAVGTWERGGNNEIKLVRGAQVAQFC